MSESPPPRGSETPPRGERVSPISEHENAKAVSIFSGLTFWVSLNVPSRLYYRQTIISNGGDVINSERDADILIVDHLKEKGDSDSSNK